MLSPLVFVSAKKKLEALAESPCFSIFSNLQCSILESSYCNMNLTPKQAKCLEAEAAYFNRFCLRGTENILFPTYYQHCPLVNFPLRKRAQKRQIYDLAARPFGFSLSSLTFWETRDQPEPGSFFPRSLWSGEIKKTLGTRLSIF